MCPFQRREHDLNNINLGLNQGHEVSIVKILGRIEGIV